TTDRVKLRQALLDVSKGGTTYGPGQIADALSAIRRGEDIDYQGVSGPCDFNTDLDATLDLMLWRVTNAAFSIVARVNASQVAPAK
ncbi:MAG: hypothetical protein KBF88_09770, partial [Polyangiaceae bacterium]|nr:hypothetical protein [Polyangiaceae bacterium]